MKYFGFLLISMLFLASCAETPPRPEPVMTQAQHDAINAESAALQAQKAAQSAAVSTSASALHYYCPAHPTKGGDAQGSCPDCGQALVHNAAFHNAGAGVTTTPSGAVTPPTPSTEPAVNAAGVYHYTCSNGCPGGAGSQANCATCGNPLVHNAAYHN
ncbi:heavy metal-binding domain-containing protein [Portibacter marinus]|uniref:heavy metal-binding domain-containing protein n=1 Tax=Portibacter marinus TaxID=2898660 RepID=UPI001F256A38|nr:heavy metal-binding domain-containing protein [Portibacter marinus]